MDMNDMLQQAQRMQMELAQAQADISSMTYTATSGGGMVKVTALGNGTIESLEIDPEAVDPDDVEMLQDLIVAAVNEAIRAAESDAAASMSKLTAGMNLGGLF